MVFFTYCFQQNMTLIRLAFLWDLNTNTTLNRKHAISCLSVNLEILSWTIDFAVFRQILVWVLGSILSTKFLNSGNFSVKVRKYWTNNFFHKCQKICLEDMLAWPANYRSKNVLRNGSLSPKFQISISIFRNWNSAQMSMNFYVFFSW
jgi:hypothetical protein